MRERWLSKRAVSLHVAVLVFVPGCAVAAWWQVSRAEDGNQLSYLYSVMWPVFGLLAIFFWWMLIHTDYDTVGLKGMQHRQAVELAEADGSAGAADQADAPEGPPDRPDPAAASSPAAARAPFSADDDPELAAYNARLAELAAKGAKTWRNRESVVVRRGQ